MRADPAVLVNGNPQTHIDVFDRGFHYGDGAFETIAVFRGEPLLWSQHIQRLSRGAQRLGIPMPDEGALLREARELCQDASRVVLKIILTRGSSGRGYAPPSKSAPTRVMVRTQWPDYPDAYYRDGVDVRWCETRVARQPRLAGIKHLNRLEQVLARAECGETHAEGLMCDEEGFVIEGTMSNVFTVSPSGELRTPDVSACGVEGVLRAEVLRAAARLGLRCDVARLARRDIESAAELFLTNSLIGIWPVRSLEGRRFAVGPITRSLQDAVNDAHCFARR